MYAARAPAGVDVGTPSGMIPIARGDIKWGSLPLDVLQHPTVLLVGTAFVVVVALQDISMSAALITGVTLCVLEAVLTTGLYTTGRLKHCSYALNHCFFWPLITWLVVMWWDPPRFHEWMMIALWGGVTTLMSITMLLNISWARDLLKDKTPANSWDAPWWEDLANNITRVWVVMFTAITAGCLVPYFFNQVGTTGPLSIAFDYILPIILAALGIAITQGLITKAKEAFWDGTGGDIARGGVTDSMYEPLTGATAEARV